MEFAAMNAILYQSRCGKTASQPHFMRILCTVRAEKPEKWPLSCPLVPKWLVHASKQGHPAPLAPTSAMPNLLRPAGRGLFP
jgi:hypothetical protein